MSITKTEAIQAGDTEAGKASVFWWGLLGFIAPIVTIPVAHLRSPKASPTQMATYGDDATLRFFEAQYIQVLKSRQVKTAWIWGIIGVAFGVVGMILSIVMLTALGTA